jgi:hypothetical protein
MATDIGFLSSVTLLLFLDTHKNSLSENVLMERLNCMTSNILSDSFDSALHTLINKNGWDENARSFKANELDIETLSSSLKLFIERRESKASTIRASQVDVKNRIKSFAPDLLMTYTLERSVRSNKMELEPFSVFSTEFVSWQISLDLLDYLGSFVKEERMASINCNKS